MTTSTINLTDLILEKVTDLPPEKQQEILDFAEFVSNKYHQEKEKKIESFRKYKLK